MSLTQSPSQSVHRLPVSAPRWRALAQAVQTVGQQQMQLRAGRQRLVGLRLSLDRDWAAARDTPHTDHAPLASLRAHLLNLATTAPLEVLIEPGVGTPRLQLAWCPWHAPPVRRPASPSAPNTPTTGETTMNLSPLSRWFHTPRSPASSPSEPALQPQAQRAAAPAGQALAQALAHIAEQIHARELQALEDTVQCRYQLWTLRLYLTPANLPALRTLMEAHQRSPQVARAIVDKGLARSPAACHLNTLRLKLEFRRDDSLPREASEVLLALGRESVALPFDYEGQLELGELLGAAPPAAPQAPGLGPTEPSPGVAPALLLWAVLSGAQGEPRLQRWRLDPAAGPAWVGASDTAQVRIDQRHISGEHLRLAPDAQGRWTVEDASRNGSNLFDPQASADEQPLPARQPRPLPAAGALRLGPLPGHPLLHFALQASERAPVPAAPAPAGRGRATELVGLAPAPRSTQYVGGQGGSAVGG